jgi:hypothetical protein
MYCLCVNVYCHRVPTELQSTNISISINCLSLFVCLSLARQRFKLSDFVCLPLARQPPAAKGVLILEVSRSHNDAPQSVGLLCTSYQLIAETSTWQHTKLTTDKRPWPGGIRTHNLRRRGGPDLRLRPRSQRDRRIIWLSASITVPTT